MKNLSEDYIRSTGICALKLEPQSDKLVRLDAANHSHPSAIFAGKAWNLL
jgi:hypothetical protein